MHALTPDITAGILEQATRLLILQKIDPDLFKDGLGIGLDDLRSLVTQDIDGRQIAGDERLLPVQPPAPERICRLASRPPPRRLRRWDVSTSDI
jgi:hypothetical protein